MMADVHTTVSAPGARGMEECRNVSPRVLRRLEVTLSRIIQALEGVSNAAPIGLRAAQQILDAANPPRLPDRRRRRLVAALVLLAVRIQSEVRSAADSAARADFEAEGRKRAAAMENWLSEAQRHGLVGAAPARSLLQELGILGARPVGRGRR